MAETIGQHGIAAFTNPSNGDALDANIVKGNDNSLRAVYVDHDSDPGIHVQSSLLASRPAAGTSGRKWMTTDSGSVRLWYDDGSAWQEIAYLGPSYFTAIASNVLPSATGTYDVGVTGTRWRNLFLSNNATVTGDGTFGGTVSAATLLGSLAASYLTGTTLPSGIVTSSLTSVGTLGTLTVGGTSTIQQALEKATISATAATGTINYDALTQAVLYYTSNATANWTLNLRGSGATSLASMMSNGQALTVVFLVTNGATAYYPTVHQIDGSSVTPKWVSGTAPSAGNASAIDVYTYTVIKAAAGFTLLASRSYFK